MTDSTNPLLDTSDTPRFSAIEPKHVVPALQQRIAEYDALVDELTAKGGPFTWDGFVAPLDVADEAISRAWGPVSHLNSVMNSDALRAAYEEALPLLTEFGARVSQDPRLFAAYKHVADNADSQDLDAVQRRVLEHALRDFRLAGVDLADADKERYREIKVALSKLANTFSNNVLDVVKAYRLVIEDPKDVEALPENARAAARAKALDDDPDAPENRWTFTLHHPSLQPFMQYQPKRELREQLYRASCTRATEGDKDNTPLIGQILELKAEQAKLLGFETYAELSLARKMAETPAQVLEFLNDLAERSRPFGERDKEALAAFAKETDGIEDLQAYDSAYYREKLRAERYAFSDDEVRQYFPLEGVLEGLFETLDRLYGITMTDKTGATGHELWHDDARVLEIADGGKVLGYMFLDLFARDDKRGGAWMDDCIGRKRLADGVQLPVAYLCCNFAAPVEGRPSLLRHREVETLFHECGHALHHVLTKVDYRQVSGINEVPWDGVELPSQFHENWTWQKESLSFLASHWESSVPLPDDLLGKMLAAKTFMGGADMLRQLEFALFDMELHAGFDPKGERTAHDVLLDVRERVAVFETPDYNRFENAFSHIFAGGYAAGYFSYKWAEVLAADAFSRFEEEGLFSPAAGGDFRRTILEQGGSKDLMELYVEFRGRQPNAEALMRHSGLVEATTA